MSCTACVEGFGCKRTPDETAEQSGGEQAYTADELELFRLRREVAELRAERARLRLLVGEAWFHDGADLVTAVQRKCERLEQLAR